MLGNIQQYAGATSTCSKGMYGHLRVHGVQEGGERSAGRASSKQPVQLVSRSARMTLFEQPWGSPLPEMWCSARVENVEPGRTVILAAGIANWKASCSEQSWQGTFTPLESITLGRSRPSLRKEARKVAAQSLAQSDIPNLPCSM